MIKGDTAHLSIEEDGAYSRLIRLCWRTSGCSVPNDPAWIMKRMRANESEYNDIIKPVITEYFTIKNGRVFQKRLQQEFDKVSAKIKAQKLNGKKGGVAKALNNNNKKSSQGTISPLAKTYHPELDLEPELEVDKQVKKKHIKKEILFEEFWNSFDHKVGKDGALKSWFKIVGLDQDLADQIIQGAKNYAIYRKTVLKPNNSTSKMAQGWLTDKRWEDELPKYTNGHSETSADFGEEETDHIVTKSYTGQEAKDLFQ